MPINLLAFERDLRAMIADIPCKMRVGNGPIITCAVTGNSALLALYDGGPDDEVSLTITAVSADFNGKLPVANDVIKVLFPKLKNKWLSFEIRDTPNIGDPASVSHTMVAGSPNKR